MREKTYRYNLYAFFLSTIEKELELDELLRKNK